jgi:predicted amidohydrolase
MKIRRILIGNNPRWLLVRIVITATLLLLFRHYILAVLAGGYDLVWMQATGAIFHHPGAIRLLLSAKTPGVYMLVWRGAADTLPLSQDAAIVGTLQKITAGGYDVPTKVNAWFALANFEDERTLRLAAEALGDRADEIRRAAATVFYFLGTERDLPVLEKALAAEKSSQVRSTLASAIAAIAPALLPEPRQKVKVAAIQFVSEFGNTEGNLARLSSLIREAAGHGARIVVVPETAIQGYLTHDARTAWRLPGRQTAKGIEGVSPERIAETVPGPSTERMAQLAGELGIYLTIPILEVERATGKYYNALCLAGPDGKLRLHYRKLHPWPPAEEGWASPGDRGLQFSDTEYGRLALLICFDINFEPPNLRKAAVDILLYAIAWVDRPESPWFASTLPRLARDNNFSIVGANWTVPRKPAWSGYGHSLIIEKSGKVLARAVDNLREEIVYAELPADPR